MRARELTKEGGLRRREGRKEKDGQLKEVVGCTK